MPPRSAKRKASAKKKPNENDNTAMPDSELKPQEPAERLINEDALQLATVAGRSFVYSSINLPSFFPKIVLITIC